MQLAKVFTTLITASMTFLSVNAGGGFSASCTNIRLSQDHFLSASCGDGRGGTTNSALDLNACIGIVNSGVSLRCAANGNYAALGCNDCTIGTSGSFMRCHCGGGLPLDISLDDCVANRFGLLSCN